MPEAIDNLYRVLNDLIAACRDAEEGYGKTAKGVHSDELRDLLTLAQVRHGRGWKLAK